MLTAVVTLSPGDDPTDLNNARDYITDFQLAPAVVLPRKAWTISPHERSGDPRHAFGEAYYPKTGF